MTTLAALCTAADIDIGRQAVNELDRVSTPAMIDRIREKQKSKPHNSPLPGTAPRAIDCTRCNDRRTVPSIVAGYWQDCPECCGEEG
jgi:hypothetical protein